MAKKTKTMKPRYVVTVPDLSHGPYVYDLFRTRKAAEKAIRELRGYGETAVHLWVMRRLKF